VVGAGKIQPFTWTPYAAEILWTVEVDMMKEEKAYVANSTTSPDLSTESHSAKMPAP
jgi:hypothetical protein